MTSTFYPAPGDLLPWITRDARGVWTGREYPTAEQARAAEPDAIVQADNYVAGQRWNDPPRHAEPTPPKVITPAWTPDPHIR